MNSTIHRRPRVVLAVVAGLAFATSSCTGSGSEDPQPADSASAPAAPAAPAEGSGESDATTDTTVGRVAGRLSSEKRQRIKQVATDIADSYLDGAFGGGYPRTDFSAAFVDFRAGARRSADQDLSLLTNSDIGARVTSVAETKRRVRVDVLAPNGRLSAATVRFVLDLDTTGEIAQSMRVAGSLLLTNQQGAWKVFGYDVRPEVRP